VKYWYGYVGAFYLIWIVLVAGFGYWSPASEHWPIAVVMILGSIVAGSTPLGGGTVAFPVLVLLFGQSPDIGRNFGMAIQALGMTSAMIFIFARRMPVQPRMLVWGSMGAAAGLLLGTFSVAPRLSGTLVKLLFASLWLSFGLITLAKNHELCRQNKIPAMTGGWDVLVGLVIGFVGGVINSIIGVGIEMVLYTVLVLRYRCDLKAAIPTAVSLGALTSVMGIGLRSLIGDISTEVLYSWLAAGPIVVFGAPLGAFLVSVIPRIRTLYFVSILCVVQFVWTLNQVSAPAGEWIFVIASLLVANLGFILLYRRPAL
jgi:uncharacterized membrane protein YfcA